MKRALLGGALALLAAAALGWAQPPADLVIRGRVTDASSGQPVSSAQVFVDGGDIGVLTDRAGTYEIHLALADASRTTIRIVVQRLGFRQAWQDVDVTGATFERPIVADFALEQAALQLDEVIATGTAGGTQRRAIGNAVAPASAAPSPFAPGIAAPGPAAGDFNREQYAHIAENDFLGANENPLSTFSIDVDRASYSNVRRYLREGRRPPVDAVQIEEMVNYFSYDYPEPDGEHPVSVTTEVGVAPWQPEHRILRIGLASSRIDTESLPPSNIVFLLDVSGSMDPWDKLPLVKHAMRMLVEQLRPEDRVAIVVYAGAAGLVLDSTPGSDKERILDAIENLRAGGSTAGGAGIRLAYRVVEENFINDGNNRVILATDGDFNVGPSSDSEMVRLIEEKREGGAFLTVLGFGTGNLQSEKMQQLAQHGNGSYGYIDSLAEARKILIAEMGATLLTVAQDVKLQVEFNPATVLAYRLIGYENRLLAAQDFNDDTKDAGELGAGHRVTALYEIVPIGAESPIDIPGVDPLRYRTPDAPPDRIGEGELALVRLRYKAPRGDTSRLLEHVVPAGMDTPSADFRFATAVAGFGMLLRNSEHRGTVTTDQVLELAREGIGADPDGYRRGFIDMVAAYREIASDR